MPITDTSLFPSTWNLLIKKADLQQQVDLTRTALVGDTSSTNRVFQRNDPWRQPHQASPEEMSVEKKPYDYDKGKPSKKVTADMARKFHELSKKGWLQSRIAAEFDVNQGRVSEVLNGVKFPGSDGPEPPKLF